MTSIKLRELDNKLLKVKLVDYLDNEILKLEFDKPNISVKSFLNHLDLKLSPLKHWTLQKNKKADSDYILTNSTTNIPIWISQEMINSRSNLTFLHLLEIFNYEISDDEFIIKLMNVNDPLIKNDMYYIIKIIAIKIIFIITDPDPDSDHDSYTDSDSDSDYDSDVAKNAISKNNIIKLFNTNNNLLFYYLSIIQKNLHFELLKFDKIEFDNLDKLIINAIKRDLLILDIDLFFNYVIELSDNKKKKEILLLAIENHPKLLGKLLDIPIFNDESFFEKAIKYFPDNIKYIDKHKTLMSNYDFFKKSIIKYNCRFFKFDYGSGTGLIDTKNDELIIISLKKNYINIRYIEEEKINHHILITFLESFIKVHRYNFRLINLLYPQLFKNLDFIKICLDKNLGKNIIKFIDINILKDKIELILNFIRQNCFNEIKLIIKPDHEEKLINLLLNEGFIDEALLILKKTIDNLTYLDQDIIMLIIKTKKIDKIKKLNIIKEINYKLIEFNINTEDDEIIDDDKKEKTIIIKKIIIEIVENGLLNDLIKISTINSESFIKFLKDNNLTSKLDKFTLNRIKKDLMNQLLAI